MIISELSEMYPVAWRNIIKQIKHMQDVSDADVIILSAHVETGKLVCITQTDMVLVGSDDCMMIRFEARLPVDLRVVH